MRKSRILSALLALVLLIAAISALAEPATVEEEPLEYWLGVDLSRQRVTVYRTADNSVAHTWICSTGKSSTPTPAGVYRMPAARNTNRHEWYDFGSCYVKYATRVVNGIYFHSVLFSRRSDSSLISSSVSMLGKAASHGCIRLHVANAKWISDNCPIGTLVVIHKGPNDSRITKILGAPAGEDNPNIPPVVPEVHKVELDRSGTVILQKGEQLQLNCAVTPADVPHTLTWKSNKAKVAAVNESGLVTAMAKGSATITVRSNNGCRDTVKIKVEDHTAPTRVALAQKGTITMNMGDALQLSATLSPVTAISDLTWSSSKNKVCVVDANGRVTALNTGSAKITVRTYNKKKATVKIKVVNPYAPTRVAFPQGKTITVQVGQTLKLNPVLTPNNAVTTLSYYTSKRRVATVAPDGTLTAHKRGSCKITVRTSNGKKARITIKVINPTTGK